MLSHSVLFIKKVNLYASTTDAFLGNLRMFYRSRSSHRKCSVKAIFLKISQYSQKNACVGVIFLIKFLKAAFSTADLLKRDSNTGVFK